jgi:NAD(P)-dependent dehydrogenase (short-subunit alcohol dehydrogenase family)
MSDFNSETSVIVVTGGNRGIGFEICRQLASRGAHVVLTARKHEAGLAAVKQLADKQLSVHYHQLDVTDAASMAGLKDYLEGNYGRLDGLINNAGILPDGDASAQLVGVETIRATLETNALAPLRLSQLLTPLLKRSTAGRIINQSSGMAGFSTMKGDHAAYRLSKVALNGVTAILADELRGSVRVNSVCPGWVKTDMGGASAERDVAQGADSAVWLALDAPLELTGNFVRDREIIPW